MNSNINAELVDDIKSKIQYLKRQKTSLKEYNEQNNHLNIEISKDSLKQFRKSKKKSYLIKARQ